MKILSCLTLILALPLSAQTKTISKSEWIKGMTTALPAEFCRSEQYFRQCYRVSAQKCEEVAASVTRICLDKYAKSMPASLRQPQDGQKWGATVGSCAGKTYGVVLKQEFINSKICNDVNYWTKPR